MLLRNSSRNKQRRPLSRSKPTSSVVRSSIHALDFIDPVEAERDAHIAALLSYGRGHGRYSHDMVPLPRDPASFVSERADSVTSSTRQSLERSGSKTGGQSDVASACTLKRQQSVRFAGPSARPRRTLASRASENHESLPISKARLNILADTGNRPASTQSYSVRASNAHSLTQRYLHSLQEPYEYYTPEDDVASEPSSYRKVRKSKSMSTSSNGQVPGYYFNNGTPKKSKAQQVESRYKPLNKENAPLRDSSLIAPKLRAPKSMSFLRSRRDRAVSRSSSRAENDLAVHLAREKFRQQVEQQGSLRSHPSMFFRSKNKRSESSMGFRKSLRNSSNNSTTLSSAFSGDTISIPKQAGLRKTARKVSKTLKTKLKGLFTRPKSTECSESQVNAPPNPQDSDGESCLNLTELATPEEASMFRVRSHVPSLHAVPLNQQLKSRQGSVESAHSVEPQEVEDKSRVTSWADSVTNTLSSHGTIGDWERQRLSVIKENGAHASSSSFRPTSHQDSIVPGQALSPGMAMDSQRVYSALMKRLEDSKAQRETVETKIVEVTETFDVHTAHTGSVKGTESRRRSPSSIRCVQTDGDVFQDKSNTVVAQESLFSESLSKPLHRTSPTHTAASYKAYPASTATDSKGSSPERRRVGGRSENDQPRALTHRSSAFFASPTCHLFRTASPYRRALRENIRSSQDQESIDLPGLKYLNSLSALSLPIRQPSSAGSDKDARAAYTESVYSHTSEEAKPLRNKDALPPVESFPQPPKSRVHGDVTIFIDQPTYRPKISHQRDISTASSVEWKTWLSANVSKLETPVPSPKPSMAPSSPYELPTLRHVREDAEIESPGEMLKAVVYRPDALTDRDPLSPGTGNRLCSSEQNMARKPANTCTTTRDENDLPGGAITFSYSQPNLPVTRSMKRLRAVPSLPFVKAGSGPNTPDGKSKIPRMRSLNTIGCLNPSRDEALRKRRSRTRLTGPQGSSAQSSPGLSTALERQFGMAGTGSPAQRSGWTMTLPSPRCRSSRDDTEEGLAGPGLIGPELDAQAMGSKRMVDMFLSSRRRRINGSGTGGGSGSSPSAFV
ncbi:hypothetical protein G7046_g4814 [Stylonectria norvegica]|nr:hypothetical protein G7046_g4814 [Stylonectria norvegica]